ncbi:MAG: Clp protease N-terminal domain-containing protein [Blastocatellia bacterium]
MRRAIEVSKSRDHNFLALSHFFAALADVESALFAETMRAIGIDPDSVTRLLDQELDKSPVHVGRKMAIPEPTRELFNRALRRARSQGRQQIESYDLFATLFTDPNVLPAEILRRLGVDPAMAAEMISQIIRAREEQTPPPPAPPPPPRGPIFRLRAERTAWLGNKVRPFKFSELTPNSLNSIVMIEEKGVTPDFWDKVDVSLTEQERQRVEALVSSFLNKSVLRMNEATIWSRVIYPLLVLAEQGSLEAWGQLPLKAQYSGFVLEGVADGVVGLNISGITKSFCLILIEAKRGMEAQGLLIHLYAAMLAAARLNWERDNRVPQEIFGCYTVADNWTFMHGLVSDIEAARPAMTVASSREYAEKVEAETILRILKFITGKYAQGLANAA